jgi:hypothetical protein
MAKFDWEENNRLVRERRQRRKLPPFPWPANSLSHAQQEKIKIHQQSMQTLELRRTWLQRRKSSEMMKERWKNQPWRMRQIVAMAVAASKPGMSERTKFAWRTRRDEYLANARAAMAKGRQILESMDFAPLRGVPKRGLMAANPGNLHAEEYRLIAPDGRVYVGRNIADFVRSQSELFSPDDLKWNRHTCNAAKSLAALRPWASRPIVAWKGWRWSTTTTSTP